MKKKQRDLRLAWTMWKNVIKRNYWLLGEHAKKTKTNGQSKIERDINSINLHEWSSSMPLIQQIRDICFNNVSSHSFWKTHSHVLSDIMLGRVCFFFSAFHIIISFFFYDVSTNNDKVAVLRMMQRYKKRKKRNDFKFIWIHIAAK